MGSSYINLRVNHAYGPLNYGQSFKMIPELKIMSIKPLNYLKRFNLLLLSILEANVDKNMVMCTTDGHF